MQDRKLPRHGRLIQAAILGLLLVATTVPGGDPSPGLQFCLLCGERALADFLLNIVLFVPLGLVQAWRGHKLWRATLTGAAFSLLIEISQTWIPGRFPSFDDLIANTLGALLGALLWRVVPVFVDPPRRRGIAFGWTAALFAVLLQLLGTALFQPALTRDFWYGQWTPDLGSMPQYRGTIRDVTAGAVPLPSTRLENGPATRDSLLAGAPLTIRFSAAPPGPRSIIFSIADAHQRMNFLLLSRGPSARIRFRTAAEAVGLSPVELIARRALRGVRAGDEATIVVRRHRGAFCLDAPGYRGCLGPSTAVLWLLLAPRLERGVDTVDLLFMALLLLPVGYWAGFRNGVLPTALAMLPAVLIPMAGLGVVFSAYVVVGAVLGFICGAALNAARTQHSLRGGTISA